jgi:hypothetical protein
VHGAQSGNVVDGKVVEDTKVNSEMSTLWKIGTKMLMWSHLYYRKRCLRICVRIVQEKSSLEKALEIDHLVKYLPTELIDLDPRIAIEVGAMILPGIVQENMIEVEKRKD